MSNPPTPTINDTIRRNNPDNVPRRARTSRPDGKVRFPIREKKACLTETPRASKISRETEQIRNTVIYSIERERPIERRDRLARYGVGLLNLRLGAEIRWALGPRGFKSHSRRHPVRSNTL